MARRWTLITSGASDGLVAVEAEIGSVLTGR
jgi:hypothetical protein